MDYKKIIDLIFSNGFVEMNTLIYVLNILNNKIVELNTGNFKRIYYNEVLKLQEDISFEEGLMVINLTREITDINTLLIICTDVAAINTSGDRLLLASSVERVEGKKLFIKTSVDLSRHDTFNITYSY